MSGRLDATTIIDMFQLEPLEGEGGYFRQTYFTGSPEAPDTTAIYYLITSESYSSLHRLAFDEVFHFYAGDPCRMIQIDRNGVHSGHLLGVDFVSGQRPQIVVPGGTWQGTKLIEGGSWALIGTTMTPGFRPSIFQPPAESDLESMAAAVRARAMEYLPN
jgi:predicted cupin superfamily sugar epimerase